MFQHILIPTDDSLLPDSALHRGLSLARASGARVTVVAVTEPFAVLSAEARKAAALSVPCETIEMENEHPHRGIIETATGRQCGLIAIASHAKRGITALVLNSEAVNVMTHSAIPLLVYR